MSSSSSSGGIGFVGVLTIAFVVLKLTGVIDWSWWWVLSPALFSLAVGLITLGLIIFVATFMKKPKPLDYFRKGKRIGG